MCLRAQYSQYILCPLFFQIIANFHSHASTQWILSPPHHRPPQTPPPSPAAAATTPSPITPVPTVAAAGSDAARPGPCALAVRGAISRVCTPQARTGTGRHAHCSQQYRCTPCSLRFSPPPTCLCLSTSARRRIRMSRLPTTGFGGRRSRGWLTQCVPFFLPPQEAYFFYCSSLDFVFGSLFYPRSLTDTYTYILNTATVPLPSPRHPGPRSIAYISHRAVFEYAGAFTCVPGAGCEGA